MRLACSAALSLYLLQGAPEPSLRAGQTVRGTLAQGDAANGGRWVDTYLFRATQGLQVQIAAESREFDTVLRVRGPANFNQENDDVEQGNTNSALTIAFPAAGEYRVQVQAFEQGAGGTYTLRVRRVRSSSSAGGTARRVRMGDTIERTLDAASHAYSFNGRARQRVELRAESDAFDTVLRLAGPNGPVAENDDDPEGGTTNSVIEAELPAEGEYRITVAPFRAGQSGPYRLIVREAGVEGQAGGPIAFGDGVEGNLTRRDPRRRSGEYYHRYTFDGHRGQRVAIALQSTSLDPYLILQMPNGNQEHNDDFDNARDSRLDVVLPADGEYTLIASTARRGMTGRYLLRAELLGARRPREDATAEPIALSAGTPVDERLTSSDGRLVTGEYFDRYAFHGTRGEAVTVSMTSSFVDSYLIALAPGGAEASSDDAVPGEEDARLSWTLPEDGDYTVLATSYRVRSIGSYTIRLDEGAATAEQGGADTGRIFAVCAGITHYPDSELPLCAEDGENVHRALEQTGRLEASVLLTNDRATVGNIRQAFVEMARRVRRQDLFVFFWSGHGSQAPTQDRDEPDGINESIYVYDGEILDDEMARLFDGIHARMAIIALDSCFSGGFARDVVCRRGRVGFFSSEEDVLSNVAEKFQAGGYLSAFLLRGLQGESDEDGDRVVTVDELATFLHVEWAENVEEGDTETGRGAGANQNLVVERGTSKPTDPVLTLR